MSLVRASRVASRWFQISPVRLLLIIRSNLVLGFRPSVQVPGDSNLNDPRNPRSRSYSN